jgi:glycosyltransferase involved in cell wall biosynthesis
MITDSRKLCILELINVRWYNACAYYAVTLSLALGKRGHRVIVGGDPESPPILMAQKFGLETYSELFLSKTNPFTMIRNIKRLSEFIDKERVEMINAHRGESHLVAGLAVKLTKKDIPIIRTRGDVRLPKNDIFNKYLNNSLTDKIITTAEVLKSGYIQKFGINADKVTKINSGIDENVFRPQPADQDWKNRLGISDDTKVVGIVGRLSPVKGHKYFIQAAGYVLKNCSRKVKFIIAGQDAQIKSSQLEEMTKTLGIEKHFCLIGKVDNVRKLISLLDIGVVSSVGSETICRSALEYMAMEKPVVGTTINAIPEIVNDGSNGILVPPKDGASMGKTLLELLENDQKRIEFGRKSRELIEERFTLDVFASQSEEVYFQALKEKKENV